MEAVEVPAESITGELMGKCTTPLSDDHDDKFGVPSLEELGEHHVMMMMMMMCRQATTNLGL